MRCVVTGGAGFIGSHITDRLVNAGHEVLVLDSLVTGRATNVNAAATFSQLDIRQRDDVLAAFANFKPETIFHQAAQTSVSKSVRDPILDAESNVLGTLNIILAAREANSRRIVFASTGGAIYGEVPDGRASLTVMPLPQSPYASSKLAGESYLRTASVLWGVSATVLRYANVYGPRQDPHGEAGVVAIFSERILKGEPITVNARKAPGDGGCIRDYVFVDDVTAANLRALDSTNPFEIINVATGLGTSTEQLANTLARLAGKSITPTQGGVRAGDLERSVLEPSVPPIVSLDEGLKATLDYFRR